MYVRMCSTCAFHLYMSSLERLSVMFELPEATVHSIISKMIIKEELLVSVHTCNPVLLCTGSTAPVKYM